MTVGGANSGDPNVDFISKLAETVEAESRRAATSPVSLPKLGPGETFKIDMERVPDENGKILFKMINTKIMPNGTKVILDPNNPDHYHLAAPNVMDQE